jgi:hypothetical protein
MSNYPSLIIHTCSEDVSSADYLDINYLSAALFNIPKIIAIVDENVNVFISNVTISSARLNFSTKYTGKVRYSVISFK